MIKTTPETDAAWKEGNAIREWTCRKLERERDEARHELAEEMKFHNRTHIELIQTQCKLLDMEMQRDEAREDSDQWKDCATKLVESSGWHDQWPQAVAHYRKLKEEQ